MVHILKRVLQGSLTVLLLVLAIFVLVRALPGDPARAAAGPFATPEDVESIREQMGLDEPLHVQIGNYLKNVVSGDLGESIRTGEAVSDQIVRRIGRTVILAISATSVAMIAAVSIAVVGVWRRNTWIDSVLDFITVLGYGTPVFWIALVAIDLIAVRAGLLPTGGANGWTHLILPSLVLGFFLMGPVARIMRTSLDEVLGQDYIDIARAKGLSERRVLGIHALRNALLPTLAYLGTQTGVLFGGAAITETVFAWNGLGQLVVTAALSRDFVLLQGIMLVIGLGYVVINSSLELAYGIVDPRIRVGTR